MPKTASTIRALRTLLTTRVLIKRSSRLATPSFSAGIELGAADRYIIRGVSFSMDDTTIAGSGFTNPLVLHADSQSGAAQFSLTNTRKAPGLPVWTAPQGATVVGNEEYVFEMPLGKDDGPGNTRRRDAILSRVQGAGVDGEDDPGGGGR